MGFAIRLLGIFVGIILVLSIAPDWISESNYEQQCRQIIRDTNPSNRTDAAGHTDESYSRLTELGDCYATLWRFPEAIATFEKAYKINPATRVENSIAELKEVIKEAESERSLRDEYWVMRDLGPAARLTGKTVVAYLFVETNESQWSSLDREQAISTLEFVQRWYKLQAKNYQLSEPTFVNRIFQIRKDPKLSQLHNEIDIERTQLAFARHAVHKLGFNTIDSFVQKLKTEELADNGSLIIHLNKENRSFAEPCTNRWCGDEFAFVLQPVKNTQWQYLHNTIAHEALHLFGADDLYNIRTAKNYAPSDIMHYGARYLEDTQILGLTAYAIGWTDDQPTTPFPIHNLGD